MKGDYGYEGHNEENWYEEMLLDDELPGSEQWDAYNRMIDRMYGETDDEIDEDDLPEGVYYDDRWGYVDEHGLPVEIEDDGSVQIRWDIVADADWGEWNGNEDFNDPDKMIELLKEDASYRFVIGRELEENKEFIKRLLDEGVYLDEGVMPLLGHIEDSDFQLEMLEAHPELIEEELFLDYVDEDALKRMMQNPEMVDMIKDKYYDQYGEIESIIGDEEDEIDEEEHTPEEIAEGISPTKSEIKETMKEIANERTREIEDKKGHKRED